MSTDITQREERLALRTEKQASEILSIPLQTLRKWRCLRQQIPFVKLGRSVRYRLADLENFLNSKTIQPR